MSALRGDERVTLRAIDIRPMDYGGPALMLRDPLRLSENYLVVPQALGALLALFDGSMTYAALESFVSAQLGRVSGPALLREIVETLDEALLLESERFRAALAAARASYAAAGYRRPALAGQGYPAEPGELRQMFDRLLGEAGDVELSPADSRAVLSPHIDYERGGTVYAQVWKSAAAAASEAELVLLLATDHYSPEPFTLTRLPYATPFGVLPTDPQVVGALADAVGPSAFDAELYHRTEHSVELVAAWLHHARGGAPVPVVPLLCGGFHRFTQGEAEADSDAQLREVAGAVRAAAESRRTLVVISGDLSHVGPAFGGQPLDARAERALRADDEAVLGRVLAGDAGGLLESVRQLRDRNNVCGLPPAYLALRALGGMRGEIFGYQRCPADEEDRSAVTVAGAVLR